MKINVGFSKTFNTLTIFRTVSICFVLIIIAKEIFPPLHFIRIYAYGCMVKYRTIIVHVPKTNTTNRIGLRINNDEDNTSKVTGSKYFRVSKQEGEVA